MTDQQLGNNLQDSPLDEEQNVSAPLISRRQLVRGSIALGGMAMAGGLLAACGGDDDDDDTTDSGESTTPAEEPTEDGAASEETTEPTATTQDEEAEPAEDSDGEAQQGGEVSYAMASQPDTLDPTITTATDVVRLAYHLFDPLLWQPNTGEFLPLLAESWEVNETADEYTFTLRNDVTFHDGTEFNAEAVKFTFDRIVDPDSMSQLAFSAIGPYESSTVVDPTTVTIKLSSPYAPFFNSASQVVLAPVSPTAVEEFGEDFGVNPVGTGAFIFESYEVEREIRIVKNPDYNWAPSSFDHQGPPYLDAMSWRVIAEPGTRLAALASGEVDVIQDVPSQDYANLSGDGAIGLLEGIQAGSGNSMMMNVTQAPTDDVEVRRAIQWAIDKEGLVLTLFRELADPACSPLTPVTFGYDAATCDVYSYDPEQASQILEDAGWVMGSGDFREKDGQELLVRFFYRSDDATSVDMATFLQANLGDVGINVELNGLARSGYFDAVRAGEHNLQFWWEPATDPDILFREFFHSSNADGGTNRNRYVNPDMDAAIDEAAAETDPEKRAELYSALQMRVLDEAIMAYLADPINVYAYQNEKVDGIVLDWSATYLYFYDATATS